MLNSSTLPRWKFFISKACFKDAGLFLLSLSKMVVFSRKTRMKCRSACVLQFVFEMIPELVSFFFLASVEMEVNNQSEFAASS